MPEVKKVADNVLKQDVGEISLLDGFLIGASKLTTEQLLKNLPYVGGTNYVSGFTKVAIAIGLSMVSKNKWVRIVQTGILLDGVEDLFVTAKAQFWDKSSSDKAMDGVGVSAFSSALATA